jgi:hypothetical protein
LGRVCEEDRCRRYAREGAFAALKVSRDRCG